MSLLLLDRLSAILACWALREVSKSSAPRGSEVTDACDRLLWDEWLPLSSRLVKSTLERRWRERKQSGPPPISAREKPGIIMISRDQPPPHPTLNIKGSC